MSDKPNKWNELYQIDRTHYLKHGFTITGIKWVKGVNDPVLKRGDPGWIAWNAARDGEQLPDCSFLLSDAPPTAAEIKRAVEIMREHYPNEDC